MSRLPQRRGAGARALGALAATALAGLALAGCSSASSAGSSTIDIVLHDNPATTTALKQMTTQFEQANPSIHVDLSFVPTNDYPATRNSRLAAKQVDIVEASGAGPTGAPNPSYTKGLAESDWVQGIQAGQWVDLSKQSFVKDYTPSVISALKVNGKLYDVPTALVYYTGVYYNKDIFAKNGITVPTTWSEFVTAMRTLKSKGITPLSAAGKDQWPVGLAAQGLIRSEFPTLSDMQQLDQGLWTGSAKFDDSQFLAIADKLKTMYGYLDPRFAGVDYATAESQFTSGKVAMTVDGTWAVQQFATANPSLNMGYFPLPASNDASDNQGLQGKIDTLTFAIPTSSKHQAAAEKWIAWFSDPTHYKQFAQVGGVIPVEPNLAPDATLQKVLGSSIAGGFQLAWDEVFHDNPKAGANVGPVGVNYAGLAPLGKYATTAAAQAAAQSDWAAGLSK